jgi:hypothetical protein
METIFRFARSLLVISLVASCFITRMTAQEVSIPDPGLDAAIREALNKPVGPVTAQDMLGLTTLDARRRSISNLQGLETARNLFQLFLDSNSLTNLDLPNTLTNLVFASLFGNQLTNLTVPANLHRLGGLDLALNHLASLNLPAGLNNLGTLVARDNQLTNLTLQADMTNLTFVDVGGNQLPSLTLPAGLKRLNNLDLSNNKLTSFTLPAGLTNLVVVFLQSNQLTNLTLSPDLINLFQVELLGNQLTSLTLPPDATNLSSLVLDGVPLTTFVLSEPQAATKLAFTVTALRNQGVSVFTYPLVLGLVSPRRTATGAFEFALTGPPGIYTVLASADLVSWNELGAATNLLGSADFTDTTAELSVRKFYRARQ